MTVSAMKEVLVEYIHDALIPRSPAVNRGESA